MRIQAVGKTRGNVLKQLSGSEAIYGFGAWLTTRDEPVTMGAKHDCGIVAELIDIFCKTNKLEEPRDNWTDNLTHPKNNANNTR